MHQLLSTTAFLTAGIAVVSIVQAALSIGPAAGPAFQLVQLLAGLWLAGSVIQASWRPQALLAAVAVQAGAAWAAWLPVREPDAQLGWALVHLAVLLATWGWANFEHRREARWNGVLPLRPEAW